MPRGSGLALIMSVVLSWLPAAGCGSPAAGGPSEVLPDGGADRATADGDAGVEDEWGDPRDARVEDGGETGCRDAACGGPTTWLVLVYMAADNDLESSAPVDLDEMTAVGAVESLTILVQVDWSPGAYDRPEGWEKDRKGTQRLMLVNGEAQVLQELPEVDSADPDTLADFVSWGLQQQAAHRVALVLWDHGEGPVGFGQDDTTGGAYMTPPEMEQALSSGMAAAGRGAPLDLVGFDACFMASYEVAWHVKEVAAWLLASEESVEYEGWDYSALALLDSGQVEDGAELGAALLSGYEARCQMAELPTFTMSLVDLSKVAALDEALAVFAEGAADLLPAWTAALAEARAEADRFGMDAFEFASEQFVDLGGFVAGAGQAVPELAESAAAVAEALAAAVVEKRSGSAHEGATGLSVYFPALDGYFDGWMYEHAEPPASWQGFLETWLAKVGPGEAGPPLFDGDLQLLKKKEDVTVTAGLVPETTALAAEAAGFLGYYDPDWDAMEVLLEVEGLIDQDAHLVSATMPAGFVALSQGEEAAYAYASLRSDGGMLKVLIPLDCWDPAAEEWLAVWMTATIDPATGAGSDVEYALATADGTRQPYSPVPGSAANPLVWEWNLAAEQLEWWGVDVELLPDEPIAVTLETAEDDGTLWYALGIWDEHGSGEMTGVVE
jgi:hypothetical protein